MAKNNLYKCLYCIIGASGSGKSSVCELLESKYHRRILRSYTTRPKRHEDDTDHIYITEEEYYRLENKVATAEIGGYHYCATKEQIDSSDYYIVDWDGYDELLDKYNGRKKGICAIYLSCPDEVRMKRMRQRGDSESQISHRLYIDETKFSQEQYDQHTKYILKFINTGNITEGVVAGVINAVAGKHDRKIK